MFIKNKKFIQIITIVISISFIFYGIYRGEVDTVFSKAIRICMECIGIG